MRILHYHRNIRLERGGVVRFVLDLSAALAEGGHEVTLASPDLTDTPAEWHRPGPGVPKVVLLPAPRRPLGLWGPRGARAAQTAVKGADVVHLHGAWMPTNLQFGRAARRLGIPYVISPHGMLDDWCTARSTLRKRIFHALVGRAFFERAAAVHCTAGAELQQSRRWFPTARAEVIPLLLDLGPFRQLPGPEEARAAYAPALETAPLVLLLSRIHPKKRPEILIDAVALLKERGVACNLFLAGSGEDGYVAALERRITERSISDRARMLGMVTGRRKVSLYQSASVFALPTSQENFGLAMVEAMACGCPVVTTRGVDIWPELEASGGALLAEPTAESFAEALGRLLGDGALRERMSGAARRWVMEHLDPGAVARTYEALYESVMPATGKSSAT